ncbi:hypothetical protein [Antrihabitans spumae]|jgi:hypothetical protein|uniref:LPXTG cell wall anchor domain-containing protein n=1 Tax=Antrihabitans spumae TaxID=3373370 RepID=A0ABW7JQZ1_9NOCA
MMLANEMVRMHAGGWDEMLAILGPLLIVVALIAIARRARPPEDEEDDSPNL